MFLLLELVFFSFFFFLYADDAGRVPVDCFDWANEGAERGRGGRRSAAA